MFKVFYSWQSDIAPNKTRYFIRDCIDKAIDLARETEAIEAERDEATQGTTGSPNIVQKIYEKIDESDLFVADLSICYMCSNQDQKKSPNPNVLIELGYAAKVLGWERVICICNTDFGMIEELPFDIAHNRVLPYSLNNGKSRNENCLMVAVDIFKNIQALKSERPRAKADKVQFTIGSYNPNTMVVEKILMPHCIDSSEYRRKTDELRSRALNLVNVLKDLTDSIKNEKRIRIEHECIRKQEIEKIKTAEVIDLSMILSDEAQKALDEFNNISYEVPVAKRILRSMNFLS